jgi:hypothetical protein
LRPGYLRRAARTDPTTRPRGGTGLRRGTGQTRRAGPRGWDAPGWLGETRRSLSHREKRRRGSSSAQQGSRSSSSSSSSSTCGESSTGYTARDEAAQATAAPRTAQEEASLKKPRESLEWRQTPQSHCSFDQGWPQRCPLPPLARKELRTKATLGLQELRLKIVCNYINQTPLWPANVTCCACSPPQTSVI